MTEYLFIKNGMVAEVFVCDEANAQQTKDRMGFDACVLRPNPFVGIGHRHRDGKFWADAPVIDAEGNQTEEMQEIEVQ